MRLRVSFVLFALLISLAQTGLAVATDDERPEEATDIISGVAIFRKDANVVVRSGKQDYIDTITHVHIAVTDVLKGTHFKKLSIAKVWYRKALDYPKNWNGNFGQVTHMTVPSFVKVFLRYDEQRRSYWLLEPEGFEKVYP